MKNKTLIPLVALLFVMGCATASKNLYNTLSSVHVTTSAAYSAYLDLVVQGKLATNSVPVISRDYTLFQTIWSTAVEVGASGVLTPATQPVTDAAARVVADITIAKGAQ